MVKKRLKYMDVKYERDGEVVDSKLPLSGHWGYSRHTNYTRKFNFGNLSAVGYQYGPVPFIYLLYIIMYLFIAFIA